MFLTGSGSVGARDGHIVRVAAVEGAETPATVTAVDQRRLVTVASQAVQPDAPGPRPVMVADRMTLLSVYTRPNVQSFQSSSQSS